MAKVQSDERSDFWALLVGINDYQAVPNLRGCVNDAQAMRDFLIRFYPNLTIKEVPRNHFDYYDSPRARQFIKELSNVGDRHLTGY